MNFYLDFEATQYEEKIISIGCVCDNGNSFYSLVKPDGEYKINNFITDLTGLTKDMIAAAPSAEEVFTAFQNFVQLNSDGTSFFYVYGNADKHFLERSIPQIKNDELKWFLYTLAGSLFDFSTIVKKCFNNKDIALIKAVNYYRREPVIQNHDALADAALLMELVYAIKREGVKNNSFIDFCSVSKKSKSKKKIELKKLIKAYHRKGSYYFTSYEAAYTFLLKNKIFKENNKEKVIKSIQKSAKNKSKYYGYLFSEVEFHPNQYEVLKKLNKINVVEIK